jgi:polyhydroxybutyrate depolymerase
MPSRRAGIRSLALVLLVCCAVALAACADGGAGSNATPTQPCAAPGCAGAGQTEAASAPAGTPAAASTAAPTTSARRGQTGAPCTPARPFSGIATSVTLDGRHFDLHVPSSYDGVHAVPLVINLHGAGSNAAQQAFYSGFNKKADAEGFITLTPDATGNPQAWNFIPLPGGAVDAGFIGDALDRAEHDLCGDEARGYATGISSGAAMSVRLACSLRDRIAAIGIVAALWYPPDCPATKAMPVLEFHGTDDPLVPFAGGTVANSGIPAPAVEDAAAAWAKADGCAAIPAQARPAAHVRTLAYSECRDNAAVILYIVEGGGHTWPGAPVDVTSLGQTNHELSATDEIWSFFTAH